MFRSLRNLLLILTWFVLFLRPAHMQNTCIDTVNAAIIAVSEGCSDLKRNQACYGHVTLRAEAQPDTVDFAFEVPGDISNVADIKSLVLSPLDESTGAWGISLMKIQANLKDIVPGQNVTMLLFGDVEITSAVDESSDDYTPMQVFYFRSGVGDSSCAEAPESGILIRTPEGERALEITLVVNEVNISLGSTAFLQAQPEDYLYIYLLDGEATVSAFDKDQALQPGQVVTIPLDEELAASGPPNAPAAYAVDVVDGLAGVITLLPEAVTGDLGEAGGCTVTALGVINMRSGPGTAYPRVGSLAENETAISVGQAEGLDGFTWWKLDDGNWVREDVVSATGDCTGLPVVADLPPMPTPAPVSGAGMGTATLHIGSSDGGECWDDSHVVVGQPVILSRVYCMEEWESFADVQASFPGAPTFSIDNGEQIVGWLDGLFCCNADGFNCTLAKANWTAAGTPGIHTLTSYLGSYAWSCTFTIDE